MTNVSRITGLLLHRLLERTDRCPIGPEDIETVCIASSLHDIGKLLIPEDILIKPAALTPGEFDIVKQHTRLGAKIISDLPIYQNETIIKYALEICRWHHERWNGEGYPDGLKGRGYPHRRAGRLSCRRLRRADEQALLQGGAFPREIARNDPRRRMRQLQPAAAGMPE